MGPLVKLLQMFYIPNLYLFRILDYGGREGLVGMGFRAFEVERQASFFTFGRLSCCSLNRKGQAIHMGLYEKKRNLWY
ncbi:MAG: hypothetical protein Ct9H300mP3_01380 [Gammaproteobacteria bacterium]|nr:MAG: hypothetical protein Ct9H300mP3_01380 [Gammaproteobacteria bacterium]